MNDDVRCSFCGKRGEEAEHLIRGPGVWICDVCVELCAAIIEGQRVTEERVVEAGGTRDPDRDRRGYTLLREELTAHLAALEPLERALVELRFGLRDGSPRTQREVSEAVGVNLGRVRDVENRLLSRLREER